MVDVSLVRQRYQRALDGGMSIADATSFANGIPAPSRQPVRLDPPRPGAARQQSSGGADPRTDSGRRVRVPDNWRDLKWIAPPDEMSIRSLAAQVSPTPVRNKADAIAAIEAYIAGTK